MKIAYIVGSLATQGGTSRMITEKANLFATQLGYDITIVSYRQRQDEINTYPLSDKVKQINIGISLSSHYKYRYPKRLWVKWSVNRHLKKAISDTVNRLDPDIIIGITVCKADIICQLKCRAKKIIECHEARVYTLSGFGLNLSLLSKIKLSIYWKRYFGTIERYADAIVTLTEKDKALWKNNRHVEVIPNFTTMHISKTSDCSSKRVIAVGRLEWEKGYSRLLQIWKIVYSKHPDWKLDIYGEGSFQGALETIIRNNTIKNLEVHHFTHDISQEFANSSICVVTSFYEAFSLVLLEAMKHGVPCIAFDCPFGPGSIIQDNLNGFLVHDGDIRLFAERICLMIEDTKMRKEFSKEAIIRANYFNKEAVLDTWKTLFESIL